MRCDNCYGSTRPVVCVDIDGTLAQYHQAFTDFAARWLNLDRSSLPDEWDGIGEFSDRLGIPKHEYRQIKLAFRAGGNKRWMNPFHDAQLFMNKLATLGVDVWITTSRPWQRMDNVDPDTKEWLRRNGIQYKHLLFDEDKYGLITQMVDPDRIVAIIDDELEQVDRCEELRLPIVLRRSAWNWGIQAEHAHDRLGNVAKLIQERIGVQDALRH